MSNAKNTVRWLPARRPSRAMTSPQASSELPICSDVLIRPVLTRRGFIIASMIEACAAATGGARPAHAETEELVLRAAISARPLGPDEPPVLSFGTVPGPIIRVRRGGDVRVRLVNALDEPAAIHWHGVRLANPMDGAPPLTQAPVAPGANFDYRFIAPDAGTFWYHAASVRQCERGLFGALIVEEPMPPPADRDHVLMFAPVPAPSASVDKARERVRGRDAPSFAINGAPSLDLAVRANERLRLRFINASVGTVMNAQIDNHRVFVMALDGQPAEPFVSRDGRIVLGPGNRADVFVDATQPPGSIVPVTFDHPAGAVTLLRLVYQAGAPTRALPMSDPVALPDNALPKRMNFARALRANLMIGKSPAPTNGGASDALGPPLFVAERGRTVTLALIGAVTTHSVHVHGHHFRLLDRLDDGWKPYWLDTILVPDRQTARIAFVADNPGRWLIEMAPLDGAPATTAWFEVNNAGRQSR
jgi:FtsP/CotA-like multicopper oxidase with cupredoxin domain